MVIKNISLIILVFTLVACRPSTEITARWQAPDPVDAPYNSIFLAAIVDDLAFKQQLENEFARRLEDRNVQTVLSSQVFRPDFYDERRPSRERLVEAVRETGMEAIMTITLIDEEREERYIPGGAGWGPMWHPHGRFGFYGTFPGYWGHWHGHGMGYHPGHVTVDRRYFMETNIYDAETMELVWSAQSETLNPKDISRFTEEYVDTIKAELRDEGIMAFG